MAMLENKTKKWRPERWIFIRVFWPVTCGFLEFECMWLLLIIENSFISVLTNIIQKQLVHYYIYTIICFSTSMRDIVLCWFAWIHWTQTNTIQCIACVQFAAQKQTPNSHPFALCWNKSLFSVFPLCICIYVCVWVSVSVAVCLASEALCIKFNLLFLRNIT